MSGYWDRNAGGVDDETERLLQRIKDLEQYRVGAEARIAELEAELKYQQEETARYKALWEETT